MSSSKMRVERSFKRRIKHVMALSAAAASAIMSVVPSYGQLRWDPGLTPLTPSGGPGTWDAATTANWSDGASDFTWNNLIAVFGAPSGAVTIDGAGVSASGLTFDASGYTLGGGVLTLTAAPVQVTNAGETATINSVIGGTAGLTKTGLGNLTLGGSNTYTGTTTINAGSLSAAISSASSAGTVSVNNPLGTGAISLNGGTLNLTPVANTAALGISGRVFASTNSDTSNINFSGTATSVRTPDASLSAASTGTIPAGTAVQWLGKLSITNAGGYIFTTASDDGSRLWIDGALVINNDGPKAVTANSSQTINLTAGLHDIRVDYVNSGSTGSETLNYRGATAGLDVPTTDTLVGSVANTLFEAESNTLAGASNAIAMGNALNVAGTSTINLNGVAFTQVRLGAASFATGSNLSVTGASGKAIRTGAVTLGSGAGTVTLNNTPDVYFDGAVSDGGAPVTLTKLGTGRLVFNQSTVANALGATTSLDIQAGSVRLVGSSAAGTFNPIGSAGVSLNGGNLEIDTVIGGTTYNNAISAVQSGTITSYVNAATTTLSGTIDIAATKTLTFDAIAGGTPVTDPGATIRLSGPLTGSGTLAVASTTIGTFAAAKGTVLFAANTAGFSGSISLLSGNLRPETPTSLAGQTINLSGGTLQLLNDGNGSGEKQNITAFTLGSLNGSGTVSIGRVGNTFTPYFASAANKTIQLAPTGSNTLTNLTVANANGYGLEITTPVTLDVTATLNATTASNSNVVQGLTLSGVLTGGSISKTGAGTVALTNSGNTFNGGLIDVTAGVLAASSDGALGDASNVVRLNTPNTFITLATTTANASNALTAISSTATLSVGQLVFGANVPNAATLTAIPTATTGTLSANATAAATNTLTYISANAGFRATGTFASSRTFQFNQAGNQIDVTAGNTLTLNSAFTGTSATTTLVKTGNGTLVLNADNSAWTAGSYTLGQGQAGGIAVLAGTLQLANASAAGAAANPIVVYNPGGAVVQIAGGITVANPLTLNHQTNNLYAGGINWSGQLQSVGNALTNTWSGLIQSNQDGGISADAGNTLNLTGGVNQQAHIVVYGGAGNINVTGGAISLVHTIDKIGSGTLNIQSATAAPSGNGIRAFAGNLTFSGAGVVGASTPAAQVLPGSTLTLDNSGTVANNRLGGPTRLFTLTGGNFNLVGGATAVTETLGQPTFGRGGSVVTIDAGTGGANLSFTMTAAINPAAAQNAGTAPSGTSVLFRGQSLGSAAGAGVATVSNTAFAWTFPGQNGADATTAKGLLPWALVDTSTTGVGTSFATIGGTTFIGSLRPLAATEMSATGTAITANLNMFVNTALAAQAGASINSLTFDTGGSIALASPVAGTAFAQLQNQSGGILVRNNVTSMISGGVMSAPNTFSPWSVWTPQSAGNTTQLTISSVMAGGNGSAPGLIKAGAGTLVLATPVNTLPITALANVSANQLAMQTVVNGGTLRLSGGTNTLGANNFLVVNPGGTLDLNGSSQYVQGLFTDGTYNGIANTVTAGGTITNSAVGQATLVSNSDNAARNWAGQITGNVFFNRTGLNSLTIYTPQTHTGGTLINGGTVSLRDYGSLATTSTIDVSNASLTLDNTQAAGLSGRLGSVPITLRNSTLTYNGRIQTVSTESFGTVTLGGGQNFISVNAGGGGGINSATLNIASLARPVGSTSTLRVNAANGQIGNTANLLIGGVSLSNNIIAPWFIQDREWATYIPGLGVAQLNAGGAAGYATNALTGAPLTTDNVRATASATLGAGGTLSINTFALNTNAAGTFTVNLNGRTLNVLGGGLISALNTNESFNTFSNGTITSGFANGVGGNDLYLYHLPYGGNNNNRQTNISAVIANNGATAVRTVVTTSSSDAPSTSPNVVTAGVNRIVLLGANTYTGGTVVNNGTVAVGTGGVIPAGGIVLNGGSLMQSIAGQASPGTINSANVVTLNGPSALSFTGNNTIAGLVFNNSGGTTTPTVNSFIGGLGAIGTGTLTIGASGVVADSSNVQTTATLLGRFDTGGSVKTFDIRQILVNNVAVAPLQATLAVQGWTGSAGGIQKIGSGVLQLNAQQTYTGATTVTAGGISFGSLGNSGLAGGTAPGSRFSSYALAAGTFLNLNNTDVTIGSLSGAGTVINVAAVAPAGGVPSGRTLNVGFDGVSTTTFSGTFARWTDAQLNPFQVNKIGGGTMTLTGASTTTNNLQVSQGGVTFSGPAGSGKFTATTVLPTGTLTLDNSGSNLDNRLGGLTAVGATTATTLSIAGGNFTLIGNSSAPTNEAVGVVNLGATNVHGPAVITLQANPAQSLTFTVGTTWGGISQGTGVLRGLAATAGPGNANFNLGAIALGGTGGGGANGTTTMSIRPDMLGDASVSGTGTGFIVKDSVSNFLRPLAAAEMADASLFRTGTTNTNNFNLATPVTSFASSTVNSLTLSGTGGISQVSGLLPAVREGLPITQTLTAGGVLAFTGNTGINVNRLAATAGMFFHTLGNTNVTAALSGTSLTKTGTGTLTVTGKSLINGITHVNNGTLILNGGDNTLFVGLTSGSPTVQALGINSPTATVDLNGNNQIVSSLFGTNSIQRYSGGSGTITNTSVTPVSLTALLGGAHTFGGVIAGNLSFTKTANLAYTLTNANTYTGATNVRANTLTLLDNGSINGTSSINLSFAGLNIDNSGLTPLANLNPQRVPANVPVNLRGGTLTMTSGGSTDTTQSVGVPTIAAPTAAVYALQGHNTINVVQAPIGGYGALTIGNLVVNADATVNLTGGNGGFFGNPPGMNNSSLFLSQLNGVAIPATITNKILPANLIANNGEFVTYVSAGTTGSNGTAWGVTTMNGNTGVLGSIVQNQYDISTTSATAAVAMPASAATSNVRVANNAGTIIAMTATLPAGGGNYNVLALRTTTLTLAFTAAADKLNLTAGGLALTGGTAVVGSAAIPGVLTAGGTGTGTIPLYVHSSGATINSAIQDNGSGGLTRLVANSFAGNLTIAGTNAYTGGTVVNGGAGVTLSSPVGAGFPLNVATGVTINNSTVHSTVAGNIASGNPLTINGGGGLSMTGANTLLSVTFNNSGGILAPGISTPQASGLTLTSTNAVTVVNDNAATVPLIVGGPVTLPTGANIDVSGVAPTGLNFAAPIVSTGAVNKTGPGILVLGAATYISSATTATSTTLTVPSSSIFSVGQTITGTNIPAATTITAITSPTTVTLSAAGTAAATNNMTLGQSGSSAFTGGINLTAGSIMLANSSTPSTVGAVVTNGPLGTGTLTMSDGTALLSDGTLRTVANAVSLGGNVTFGSLSGVTAIAGNGVTLNGTVALGSSTRTINVNSQTNTTTIGGVVSGAAGVGITKAGPGILVLGNTANSFDGPVTINAGILSATLAGSLGTGAGTGNITFGGGILQHGGTNTTDYSSRFATTANQPFYIDTVGNTVTYASALTSTGGSLAKFGTGTLVLTNDGQAYNGDTAIIAGILQLGATANNGSATGLLPAGTNILNAGTLRVNKSTNDTLSGVISGSGALVKLGTGNLTLTGINTFTGNVTLNAATPVTAGSLTVTNSSSLGVGPKVVTVISNFATTDGTLILDGTGGPINLASNISFTTSSGTGNGGITNLVGNNTINGDFTLTGGGGSTQIQSAGGNLTLTGTITPNTNLRVLILSGASTGTVSGLVQDQTVTNFLSVQKSGVGTWSLTNTNTYTGPTTITAGALNVASLANINTPSSIGTGSVAGSAADLVFSGGTLQYTGATPQSTNRPFTISSAGSFDASGSVPTATLNIASTAVVAMGAVDLARTLTLTGTNTGANIFAAVLGNNGTATSALNKTGSGSWTLTGANLYTGATTITGGTLQVGQGGVGSLAATAVTVNANATLAGSGSIAGPITTAALGHIAPGDAGLPGDLSTAGVVTLADTTTLDYHMGTPNGGVADPLGDILKVANSAAVSTVAAVPTINLNVLSGDLNPGKYDLIDYVVDDGPVATNIGAGWSLTFNGTPFGVNGTDYTFGQDQGSIYLNVINAIPEPTSVGLLAMAGLGLLARRRRNRSH
ncbi:autotransporter-associated beta strand repeat-containing protein [Humisphaera borealis]|uniref:Autotransporter-associated beta strand repeat-containing protein n=1 Tax=Humisphaera borealis TaxID=2807512 RepID=A0A7M2WYP0_9BACT|nr:autotransporter-associated beta strand repeat-containing protein [Humisphaera borealis]QOV90342.1 autotransporter-associated beta strand repeat-containing protein [Humisphaera borealis]